MICKRGTVVIVPFPFVDSNLSKPRPALVLSSSEFNAANGHTVLAMITTATHTAWPSDIPLREGAQAGLHTPSTIRMKLFTLENQFIARSIGLLTSTDMQAVCAATNNMMEER